MLTGHLNQIKDYSKKSGTLWAEPGVTPSRLNRIGEEDGWEFSLTMATDAVAGIGGCLSCNSRGYAQQHEAIYDLIENVHLVDGTGVSLEVPSSFVCGAEGLLGVVIGMKIQLKKKNLAKKDFFSNASWKEVIASFSSICSIQCLKSFFWTQKGFYIGLEGEIWRMSATIDYLKKKLQSLEITTHSIEIESKAVIATKPFFISLSTSFQCSQLEEAIFFSYQLSSQIELECFPSADIIAGALHLLVQSKDFMYEAKRKFQFFLLEWAEYADFKGASLASCHGVGMQMPPFMTPFWTEESQEFLKNLKSIFDPKNLFGRDHFFSPYGKSLEKVRI